MLKKGACYIRVSTNDQIEYSPDAQLKALKNYAKNNDIIIDDDYIFIDEGISGRNAEKRPSFQNMIKLARSKPKKFDVILVHKFDRFARSREDSVVYKSLLKKECGIKVISITESIEDDKFSVILEAMLEAMAEYYSLNLSDEVKKGMTEKATRGGYQSSPPFGYKMVNKKLEVVEEEAKAVKLIYDKYLSKETNILQIAKYINELGYTTHRNNKFENRGIEYILQNPVYIGMARWTPTGKINTRYNNQDTIITKSEHEPIVDINVFNEVQELLRENKEINRRYYKPFTLNLHWLNGLVKCKKCGATLVRNTKDYYQCRGYVSGKCIGSQLVKISFIENAILSQIKEDFTNPLNINVRFASTKKNNDEEHLIYSQLEKMKEKQFRAKEAYINGVDTIDEYKSNKNDLIEQEKLLNEKLQELKNFKQLKTKTDIIKEQLKNLYEVLTDSTVDMQKKYDIAHIFIDKIIFLRETGTLELYYKV